MPKPKAEEIDLTLTLPTGTVQTLASSLEMDPAPALKFTIEPFLPSLDLQSFEYVPLRRKFEAERALSAYSRSIRQPAMQSVACVRRGA